MMPLALIYRSRLLRFRQLSFCMLWLLAASPVQADSEASPAQLSLDEIRTFTDVFQLLRNNYVDEVSDQQLMDAAIDGMMASLDSHSRLLKPQAFHDYDEEAHGRLAGIGVELKVENGRILVERVWPQGPAAAAGVLAGEQLLAVDDVPVRGRPLPESMDALRGAPGSELSLRLRGPDNEARTINLQRAVVAVPSVNSELLDYNLAYLQLTHFHTGSAAEMEAALEALRSQAGDGGLQGIVLDLRENFGGVVKAAADIADGFLDEGLVVSAQGRDPRMPLAISAQEGQWAPGVPLVVLINGHSASAAEILAGALQDQHRATLVGETTFGKGTLQSMLKLRNGSALKLTTARYYTPAGRMIDAVGLEPDVRVGPKTLGGDPADGWQDDEALSKAVDILREAAS
jgi:carboxyl-terminal processing protease